ncbi:transposase [Nocardia donostiensis]|uniref:transposase n=1 Tax=Nocardia donostiensis TaxID=1538463 RepID=UPI0020CA4B70|nr:transposase [Nocardia donostiensis]
MRTESSVFCCRREKNKPGNSSRTTADGTVTGNSSVRRGILEGKAHRYGRTFGKVDRWLPSTRMCSVCGAVGEKKPLQVREWTCTCGVTHDRDLNAANNILAAGRAERLNACGGMASPAA